MRRHLAVALLLLAALFRTASADEDERQRAAAFAESATRHFRLGEFADALKDYTEAYRAYPEPALLFDIGQCHRKLNHRREAIDSFRSYLHEMPETQNREDVRQIIEALETATREQEKSSRPPMLPPAAEPAPPPRAPEPSTTRAAPTPAASVVAHETPLALRPVSSASKRAPWYTKWWLWTAAGVVVVAGIGIGVGVGLGHGASAPSVSTTAGTFHF
jgi:tetratricopeptide (TPR) repeat protein